MVRDDSTGRPVVGAEALIEALGRRAITDSAGRFVLGGLPAGLRMVLVRQIGYHPVSVVVQLKAGDTAHTNLRLEGMTVQLAPIEVTAAPPRGPRGIGREAFEERRRLGFGRFIDSTALRQNEHLRLSDLLRRHTGVAMVCLERLTCSVEVALNSRLRDSKGLLYCYMQIVYDGRIVFHGGPAWLLDSPKDAPNLRIEWYSSDLEAVEIYRSPAEVPQQFGGPSAACGVIVLWSRRG